MNTIRVDRKINKNLCLEEDTNIIVDQINTDFNIKIENNIKVFFYVKNSNVSINLELLSNCKMNIFSINSSFNISFDLNKENISLEYFYSCINEGDNKYLININHNKKDTNSKITNHGINTNKNKLDFIVNTNVLKNSSNVNCNQDSKIIVMNDNNCSIKPNMIIDNNDIVANHSAYIGEFNKDVLFYLNSRGINLGEAKKILSKAFLINMDLDFMQKEMILNDINLYWR